MPETLEAAPPALDASSPRYTNRRRLIGGLAVAMLCAFAWTLTSSVSSPLHSSNMVDDLDQTVLAEDGVQAALGHLHGHLNSVLWDDGRLDEQGWLHLIGQVINQIESERLDDVAAPLYEAAAMLEDGGTYQAHNRVEVAEFRYANAQSGR